MKISPFLIFALLLITKTYSQETYKVTAKNGLNIRKESSLKSEIIGKIIFNTELETVKSDQKKEKIFDNNIPIEGEWVKIDLSQFNEIKTTISHGYIFNGFLKLQKPHISVGYVANYDNLPKLKFEEISEKEFIKSNPITTTILPEIEKNDSHFTIKTKNDSFSFKNYKDHKGNEGWSGSEYMGYYPELAFHVVINSYTSGNLGFAELILIDDTTDNIFDIASIGDGAIAKPIPSPNKDYLIYYYNYIYEQKECFIALLKINPKERNNPKTYLTEHKSFDSKEWAIEEIRWSNNHTCLIKGYEEVYENKEWIKKFKYYKTEIE